MKLRLEHRIALVAAGATLAALAAMVAWSGRLFDREYTTALESRSVAVGTGLAMQVQRLLQLGLRVEDMVGFEEQCQEAVRAYGGIEQAMVVAPDGTVLFHSDPAQHGRRLAAPALLAAVQSDHPVVVGYRTASGAEAHAAIVPVVDVRGARPASVLVSFPAALVEGKARRMALSNLGVGLLVLALGAAALVAVLSVSLTRPLARLIQTLQGMRGGADLSRRVALPARGELRRLAEAFNGLLQDLQATTVSREELAGALRVLARTEERYRRLVETTPTSIFVVRAEQVVFVNPAGTRLLGARRAEELVGRPPLSFVGEAFRQSVEANVRDLLAGDAPFRTLDVELIRLDGVVRQVELTAIAGDYEGAPAAQLVVRDVTEHRAMQAQLVATGRLMALGTMARGMAHEINNPLTTVISGLQFLGSDLRELAGHLPRDRAEELASAVADALQGATKVRQVVSDLQAYSRDRELLDAVDLGRVLELAASMASGQLRDRARLVMERGALPRVRGNEARLGQVFLNLFQNAAQAIAPGRPEANEVHVGTRIDGEWLEVEVRDTGTGIPPEVHDRIFEPFFTTRATGEGSGLGLFVAHGLVRGMGGRIRFESPPGRGASFFVALPLARAPAGEGA